MSFRQERTLFRMMLQKSIPNRKMNGKVRKMTNIKLRIKALTNEYVEVQKYIINNRSDELADVEKVETMLKQQEVRKEEINRLRLSIGKKPLEKITPEGRKFYDELQEERKRK